MERIDFGRAMSASGGQAIRDQRRVLSGEERKSGGHISISALLRLHAYSSAIPFSANSFFAFLFLAKCISPMPRNTLGALVN